MGRPIPNSYIGPDSGKIRIRYHNGTSVVNGYIVKQMGSSRYKVTTDGTTMFIVQLAQTTQLAQALTAGFATIELSDVNNNVVYVKKLMTYVASTTDGINVIWGFGPASAGKYHMVVPATSVTVTPSTVSVAQGSTQQLSVTVLPAGSDQAVTYTSSATNIATVSSSGLVTGVVVGSATITVTSADGKTATVATTVTQPAPASVAVSPSTASIVVAGTRQLAATVSPAGASQSVTWTSSNTSIATVSSSGLVTAVAPGSVTITATTATGGKTATSAITVVAS